MITDLTAIGASTSEFADTTLLDKQVTQLFIKVYSSFKSTGIPIPPIISLAFSKATLKPSETAAG